MRCPARVAPSLILALAFGGQGLSAQDVRMSVAQFLELELTDQYAVAGVVIGAVGAMGEFLALQDPPEHTPLTDCLTEWQKKQPDTFITTLTTSWVQMTEIEFRAANLGGTPLAAESVAATPVHELFLSFLEKSCAAGTQLLTTGSGQLDGPYEEYYANGQASVRTMIRNGRQYGPFESFHPNGQLGRKGTLNEDGHWTGAYEEYDEAGELVLRGQYENAATGIPSKCGVWYDPPGAASLREIAPMVGPERGVRDGLLVRYPACHG